jgi:ABC-type lipoprotein release transport system permease subunit
MARSGGGRERERASGKIIAELGWKDHLVTYCSAVTLKFPSSLLPASSCT